MTADNQDREGGAVSRLWGAVVDGVAAVGTLMIGVLMVIICADIVARNAMGASLPLVSEAGALLVVTLVALQLGATIRARRLARAEFLLLALQARSPRAAALLRAAFNALGAVILGIIAFATLRVFEKDWNAAEFIGVPGIATLPTWPFRLLVLAGFTIAAIEFAFATLSALRRAVRGQA
ncbi:TRAP transporter small permease subunit [Thetidibacter halocola]|uniref:TRAP transporter small permease protein n=1 Tax=Thetidibacter halocola TaxID=2827239 RepID=A0A8J8B8E6_9RHOB|nr:TRAP transporter small permease subunit [Thetidibacter halocola]MBS0124470.1 TRAP transporter small permease subunit [Thetidibacter halocola]